MAKSVILYCVILLLFSAAAAPTNPWPITNITLSGEYKDNGDPRILCVPTTYKSILLFLLANYLAHAATVKSYPGDTALSSLLSATWALFFPSSGVIRAMSSLIRHARFTGGNELQNAIRAGALCMVVRSPLWRPHDGDQLNNVRLAFPDRTSKHNADLRGHLSQSNTARASTSEEDSSLVNNIELGDLSSSNDFIPYSVFKPRWMKESLPYVDVSMKNRPIKSYHCVVHGTFILPEGYKFAFVPSDAKVHSIIDETKPPGSSYSVSIASSYNIAKTLVAIVQTVSAAITIYSTRGNQIESFGYAAFGLTVVPYIIMSIVNLAAQLATPDYPTLYMVRSTEMEEAERRGGAFEGVIGRLSNANDHVLKDDEEDIGFHAQVTRLQDSDTFHGIFSISMSSRYPQEEPTQNSSRLLSSSDTMQDLQTTPVTEPPVESEAKNEVVVQDCWHLGNVAISEITAQNCLYIPCCSRFERKSIPVGGRITWPTFWPSLGKSDEADIKYTAQLENPSYPRNAHEFYYFFVAPLCLGLISLLVIAGLTRFSKGGSTKAQRGWTMSWLITGMILGFVGPTFSSMVSSVVEDLIQSESNIIASAWAIFWAMLTLAAIFGVLFAAAIGGIVVVIQMLESYGDCIRI